MPKVQESVSQASKPYRGRIGVITEGYKGLGSRVSGLGVQESVSQASKPYRGLV